MNDSDRIARMETIRARRAALPEGVSAGDDERMTITSRSACAFVRHAAEDIDTLLAEVTRLETSCGICDGPGPLEPAHPYCQLCAHGISSYAIERDKRLLKAVEILHLFANYPVARDFIETHDAANKETEDHVVFAEADRQRASAEVERLRAERDSILEREIESADEQSAQRVELVKRAEIAETEVARLNGRLAEMHQAMVKITRETPYPGEADEVRQHRATLIAEVGTLRSSAVAADTEIVRLRRVVEHLSHGACIMDAPDGPVCHCGLPSRHESGECEEHGR